MDSISTNEGHVSITRKTSTNGLGQLTFYCRVGLQLSELSVLSSSKRILDGR